MFDFEEQREQGLQQANTMVRDFSRVRVAPDFDKLFRPTVAQWLFDRSVAWLAQPFATPHSGTTVDATHFASARGSIAPQFSGSPFDQVGRTRVVANSRGYGPKGKIENPSFDPSLIIELGCSQRG